MGSVYYHLIGRVGGVLLGGEYVLLSERESRPRSTLPGIEGVVLLAVELHLL